MSGLDRIGFGKITQKMIPYTLQSTGISTPAFDKYKYFASEEESYWNINRLWLKRKQKNLIRINITGTKYKNSSKYLASR